MLGMTICIYNLILCLILCKFSAKIQALSKKLHYGVPE